MSTVASLLDACIDRIKPDRQRMFFPALNTALRTIARRLYSQRSDLVIGELDADAWAKATFNPATDTSFIDQGFVAGMYVETTSTSNPGPFKVLSVSATVLTTAEPLVDEDGTSAIVITSVDRFTGLPADFLGLIDKPHIDGYRYSLLPIPNASTKLQYQNASTPQYYEVVGDRLYLYPPAASTITIKGQYWRKETAVSQLSDTLPYHELFDDVIAEYLVNHCNDGMADTRNDRLIQSVDLVAAARGHRAPVEMPDGVPWDLLAGRN